MNVAPFKTTLVTICSLLWLNLGPAYGVATIDWIHQYGSSAADTAANVSADSLGGVYITGDTTGNIGGMNFGSHDAFLIKYDTAGTFQWARHFGATGYDYAEGCSADGLGNVYISGTAPGSLIAGNPNNAFVNKYDSAGNLLWFRQFGTPTSGSSSHAASADGLGNVYVTGDGNAGATSTGFGTAFLTKYDGDGNMQWARQFNTGYDIAHGVAADGLGSAYVAGSTEERLNGPHGLVTDIALTKYDANGNQLWTRQFGTNQDDYGQGVAADGLGNVYITGVTYGSLVGNLKGNSDAYLAKFDSDGNRLWTRQFGGTGNDGAAAVAVDKFGHVVVSGTGSGDFTSPASPNNDAFAVEFDAAGNLLKAWQFGPNFVDEGSGAATDGLGHFYIGGRAGGALADDMSAGNYDPFLIKFSPHPIPEPGSILLAALGAIGLVAIMRRSS